VVCLTIFYLVVLWSVLVDDREERCESDQQNCQHHHEHFYVDDRLSDQSDEVGSDLEESHPVEEFNPKNEASNGSNLSNPVFREDFIVF
jgi:hypothetical protein